MSTIIPTFVELLGAARSPKAWREREIALNVLGILAALEADKLSVEEACRRYLTLDNLLEIRRQRLAPEVRQLFAMMMEAEDIEQLVPDALPDHLEDARAQALAILSR